jgi:hypothetical protein
MRAFDRRPLILLTTARILATVRGVIEAQGQSAKRIDRFGPTTLGCRLAWVVLCWVAFTGIDLQAGPLVNTGSPIGFFTNVADRLLQSQLGLSLNHIQVYPTNQYTPSVHRLLQVAANLYDATTNRTFNVPGATNGFPTVFRPLFMQSGNQVFINGYDELDATTDLNTLVNPTDLPHDFSNPADNRPVPRRGMVYGIPLVIGARKGYPNFNEFAMYSQIQITRKLQYHRPGNSTTQPINEIDQMFVAGISNVLGVEAWNSYGTAYPRPLQLVVLPDVTVMVTNLDTGHLLRYSSFQPQVSSNILAPTWAGYDPAHAQYSFQVPFLTNLVFLSNMTYQAASDAFMPLTAEFERNIGSTNFHIPHWGLNMRTRLQVALFDTVANRIVDYVNLAAETNLDITSALTIGGACGSTYTPDGSNGSMWCTNRINGVNADYVTTYGIQNQIEASVGHITVDWNNSTHEFPQGMSVADAIAFFKGQFIPSYVRSSNTFAAPYQPFRNIYLVASWQANDPLVHYTTGDLANPWMPTLMTDSLNPSPTANLGRVNDRYEPWGGNPSFSSASQTKTDLTVKDPLIFGSDYWDFPTNLLSNLAWLGRVHRGTPWQTLYLKSFGVTNYPNWFNNWRTWTGNAQYVTNWNGLSGLAPDAFYTQPTHDWRLASLVVSLLNTNDPRNLASVNQPSVPAWSSLLDGMTVLTNSAPLQFDPVIVSSNSPQAATVAAALDAARASRPGQRFRDLAEILAIPELSLASPWLDPTGASKLLSTMNDEACEALPSQLLALLRPDSTSSVFQTGATPQVQFTGADGYAYVVQTSSNLLDWTAVSTNYPANGSFNFIDTPPPGSPRRFYRSVLQP